MRILLGTLLLFACLGSCAAEAPEPVVGGPCDGCEAVFVGMPEQIGPSARIAPPDQKGQALVLQGTVRNPDGTAATGIIVYAYHTDGSGVYPRGKTRHGSLRGWARTDAQGHYRFETIRPGAYPSRDNPQHIHMHVIEPGRATYYIDDVVFDDDPLLTPERRKQMRSGRGGFSEIELERDAEGVWQIRRDVDLGRNIPGYSR